MNTASNEMKRICSRYSVTICEELNLLPAAQTICWWFTTAAAAATTTSLLLLVLVWCVVAALNPCNYNNAGCEQQCVRVTNAVRGQLGYECRCQHGVLAPDGHTCVSSGKTTVFYLAWLHISGLVSDFLSHSRSNQSKCSAQTSNRTAL